MKKFHVLFAGSVGLASALAFFLGVLVSKNNTPPLANIPGQNPYSNTENPLEIHDLDAVWNKLQNSYYDPEKLKLDSLEWSAVKGFVNGIKDPYTVFMTPEEAKDFDDGLKGQLTGIGAELEVKDGKLIIVTPLKNSPAERAGLRPRDIILKINDEFADEMTLFDAIHRIRGKEGTRVTLTLLRAGDSKPFEVAITRKEITIDSVVLKELEGGVLHLAVYQFNDRTMTEFENALQKILLAKSNGLILDLRGNGGGYLDIAVAMLSELLEGKKTAVIIKKRDPKQTEKLSTTGSSRLADIPLLVLVDGGSASASEIVAGAIQDHKRGVLVGEKTFGKGSVQELSSLPDGAELRLTIAKWFTPSDRSIDETGITPDVTVKMTDEDYTTGKDPQLQEAIRRLKKS